MKLSSYCDYVLPVLDVCIQCREHAIFVGRCALEIVNGAAPREACSYFLLVGLDRFGRKRHRGSEYHGREQLVVVVLVLVLVVVLVLVGTSLFGVLYLEY